MSAAAPSLAQALCSLILVVGLILGLAWIARRLPQLRGSSSQDVLHLKASLSVGMKERVVLVEALDQQFLIGVAPGQVSILKALGPVSSLAHAPTGKRNDAGAEIVDVHPHGHDAVELPPSLRDSFAIQLKRLLGR
jgi:flagellar biosynthetic protein FliO